MNFQVLLKTTNMTHFYELSYYSLFYLAFSICSSSENKLILPSVDVYISLVVNHACERFDNGEYWKTLKKLRTHGS